MIRDRPVVLSGLPSGKRGDLTDWINGIYERP
jgi:hypothetical protein